MARPMFKQDMLEEGILTKDALDAMGVVTAQKNLTGVVTLIGPNGAIDMVNIKQTNATSRTSFSSALSNGTDTSGTYRVKHVCKSSNGINDIALVYANSTSSGASPDQVTVSCAIEYPAGTFYQLFFDGGKSIVLETDSVASTDRLSGLQIPAGATFWSRTYVSVAAGKKWPLVEYNYDPTDGNTRGNPGTNLTVSGTITAALENAFQPIAVICDGYDQRPSWTSIGDSIGVGVGDTIPASMGWVKTSINGVYGLVNMGLGGETAQTYANKTRQLRGTIASSFCTHAVVGYGINDLSAGRTLVQIKADLQTIWDYLARRGIKVYQMTITPKTSSTDSWATVANQTILIDNSVKSSLNDWIRSIPTPLSGFFETADAVESSRNSGKWKAMSAGVYPTVDGVHPTHEFHGLMAAAANISVVI